jgi:hypothetical protein
MQCMYHLVWIVSAGAVYVLSCLNCFSWCNVCTILSESFQLMQCMYYLVLIISADAVYVLTCLNCFSWCSICTILSESFQLMQCMYYLVWIISAVAVYVLSCLNHFSWCSICISCLNYLWSCPQNLSDYWFTVPSNASITFIVLLSRNIYQYVRLNSENRMA